MGCENTRKASAHRSAAVSWIAVGIEVHTFVVVGYLVAQSFEEGVHRWACLLWVSVEDGGGRLDLSL